MKSFGKWFSEQKPAEEDELPDGLYLMKDGRVMTDCRVCGNPFQWDGDPNGFDPDMAYCGGSPSCCP